MKVLSWEAFLRPDRYSDRPAYGLRGRLACSFCLAEMTFEGATELAPYDLKNGPNNVDWLVGHVQYERPCPRCGLVQIVPDEGKTLLMYAVESVITREALAAALEQLKPATVSVVDRGPAPADDDFMRDAFKIAKDAPEIRLGASG